MRNRSIMILVSVVIFAAGVFVGCGGDDSGDGDGTNAAADTGAAGGASSVTVKMDDFFFDPKDATSEAGSVTISAPNIGKVEHELVLFKSDADPASLPVSGGKVDEEALEEQGAEEIGEIEGVQPGKTKEATLELTAGKYVMFCNLPAHYEQGMYGSFTAQ